MADLIGTLVDISFTGPSVRNDIIKILEKHAPDRILVHTLRHQNNSERIMFYYTGKMSRATKKLVALSDNPRRSCQHTQIPIFTKRSKFRLVYIAAEHPAVDSLAKFVIQHVIPHIPSFFGSD